MVHSRYVHQANLVGADERLKTKNSKVTLVFHAFIFHTTSKLFIQSPDVDQSLNQALPFVFSLASFSALRKSVRFI